MIYCKHCGKEVYEGQKVCLSCGMDLNTPFTKDIGYCSNCGAEVNSKASVCTKCGFALNQKNSSPVSSDRDKKLTRSRDGKKIAGVFSGLGKKWDVKPSILRIIAIASNFLLFGWLIDIAYIIAIFALPLED